MAKTPVFLGLDFGTESVRALFVDARGQERGAGVVKYRHGQILDTLPGDDRPLPPYFALQHPGDWIDAAGKAVKKALRKGVFEKSDVQGIGVDFTSCTMLPATADGAALCESPEWRGEKYAWPKLWKHHAAQQQTDRLNEVARQRKEKWLDRYGGVIGLEWFFPKVLESLEHAPQVYEATDVWIEAGDWFVWRLVGGPAETLPRSTCQAGYKAIWSADDGYPSPGFFKALDPRMARVAIDKMPGRMVAPGQLAGHLQPAMARKLGLPEGIPVSAAVIDAHAGVPGAGVSGAGALVMVMGTSSCHMLNSKTEALAPGLAGVVKDGILPGYFGYETGQPAVGDAFDWLRRLTGRDFDNLAAKAEKLPPGAGGVLCLDWLNGCRSPWMDGSLRGAFLGLTLHSRPGHLYRALLEASALGVRWIVDTLRAAGVSVKKLVATGGLPHKNRLLMQIYADALGKPIYVPAIEHGPALGAAILGATAAPRKATGFRNAAHAIKSMAPPRKEDRLYGPDRSKRKAYDELYKQYREAAEKLRPLLQAGE